MPRDKAPKKALPELPTKGIGKGSKKVDVKRKLVEEEEEEMIELDDDGSYGEKAGKTKVLEKPQANETVESALEVMMLQMQASKEALLAKAPAAAKENTMQPASVKDGKSPFLVSLQD